MRRSTRLVIGVVALAVVAIPVLSAQAATGLSAKERATLQSMREEEKLAHDVYVVLAGKTGDVRFTRIAAAEIRHGQALERVMAANGVADPTDGYAAGRFPTPAFQKMYDELVAQGSVSLAAALEVGRQIEREDIADLTVAITETDDAALDRVYAALKAGSTRHLAAFQARRRARVAACRVRPARVAARRVGSARVAEAPTRSGEGRGPVQGRIRAAHAPRRRAGQHWTVSGSPTPGGLPPVGAGRARRMPPNVGALPAFPRCRAARTAHGGTPATGKAVGSHRSVLETQLRSRLVTVYAACIRL